jgi:hypothetical protein
MILPVTLCGHETLSLILRKQQTKRVKTSAGENILTKKGTRGYGKLHNEKLHNLKSSPNIIRMTKSRRMKWIRKSYGRDQKCIQRVVTKSEGKRPF